MRPLLPGLITAFALGLAGLGLGVWFPDFGAIPAALTLGVLVGNLAPGVDRLSPGLRFADKKGLALALVLLGLQLDGSALLSLSASTLPFLGAVVLVALVAGPPLGRALGLDRDTALLVSVGQAICGTSAVAATAPAIRADSTSTGVAFGVINLLGTLGLIVVPVLAWALDLSSPAYALLLGGTLQSVGHVVAAGTSAGAEVGELATLIKMGRVALLPLVVLWFSLRSSDGERTGGLPLPPDVLAFGGATVLGLAGLVPAAVIPWIDPAGDVVLAVAMGALGTGIRVDSLWSEGPRALLAGALLFALQLALVLAWTLLGSG